MSQGVPAFFSVISGVFIRQKRNKSGLISVQVIEKSRGKYQVLKTIGSSEDAAMVQALVLEGKAWILQKKQLIEFDFEQQYKIFEGGKYEGHTMLPIINLFRRKYKVIDLIVVADAGLLSDKNMRVLRENNYSYILGARIKNESDRIKAEIMQLSLANVEIVELKKDAINRLIISYSTARATKDAINRERGGEKTRKAHCSRKAY